MSTPVHILKQYWGYSEFRPLQASIINAVLEEEDVLAILPTGGGKSICFQVPAMLKDGLCLVVSPLIALMKDQVEQLQKRGIQAMAIYAGMSYHDIKRSLHNAAYGNYKFLYVSPERMETTIFKEYLPALNPSLIAVDEAHCISQWGYDFRPSYLNIADIRNEFPHTPVIALTASATLEVQQDICEKLMFGSTHKRFQASFARPNLQYKVVDPPSKAHFISNYLAEHKGAGIVYGKSRKACRELAMLLQSQGVSADYYHAGLSQEERHQRQESWVNNRIQVMVCTNAFGMGIDKADVRFVIHHQIPESIESYYQEAGRAGRDGAYAEAILLFSPAEKEELEKLTSLRYPEKQTLRHAYFSLMNYLHIDAGVGEGCSRDFDLADFARETNMSMPEATYILQTLEQLGIFYMNDGIGRPSSITFTTDKYSLYAYESQQPELYDLIMTLLRNYEGIFDEPVNFRESYLARLMQRDETMINQQLLYLHQQGIIHYRPSNQKPEITLLQNRMYKDDFYIDFADYESRKQKHRKRMQAMFSYAESKTCCRATYIANYFNEQEAIDCHCCDNCLHKKNGFLKRKDIPLLLEKIMQCLKSNPKTKAALVATLSDWSEKDIDTAVLYLLNEEKISEKNDGLLTAV